MDARERHIRVPRTARYRVLGDPRASEEVWFVLHGFGQLAGRFIERFRALPGAGSGRAVVAPEALNRYYVDDDGGEHGPEHRVGATWMTRADREHEIRDYVEYLDRVVEAVLDPDALAEASVHEGDRRLVVLGFSQGAATASRWATYGRVRPAELVLWAGGLATDLDMARAAEALAGVRVRFVVGADDQWAARRAAESARRLEAVGLPSDRLEFRGGHELRGETLVRHWGRVQP